jgi:Rieske Fe-S protein
VVQRGLRKVAVYRDPQGALHECSAVCPHLGGVVAWNDVEKSWDCPCHGSRFDSNGRVLNGPANRDLEPA